VIFSVAFTANKMKNVKKSSQNMSLTPLVRELLKTEFENCKAANNLLEQAV